MTDGKWYDNGHNLDKMNQIKYNMDPSILDRLAWHDLHTYIHHDIRQYIGMYSCNHVYIRACIYM